MGWGKKISSYIPENTVFKKFTVKEVSLGFLLFLMPIHSKCEFCDSIETKWDCIMYMYILKVTGTNIFNDYSLQRFLRTFLADIFWFFERFLHLFVQCIVLKPEFIICYFLVSKYCLQEKFGPFLVSPFYHCYFLIKVHVLLTANSTMHYCVRMKSTLLQNRWKN